MAKYRIAYDAKMNGKTYHQYAHIKQKFPPTKERAKSAAKRSFKEYVDSRRNLQRLRVTGISKIES